MCVDGGNSWMADELVKLAASTPQEKSSRLCLLPMLRFRRNLVKSRKTLSVCEQHEAEASERWIETGSHHLLEVLILPTQPCLGLFHPPHNQLLRSTSFSAP